jgi:hypothetical protein
MQDKNLGVRSARKEGFFFEKKNQKTFGPLSHLCGEA